MKNKGFITERLIGIFFLGCGLISYPILTVFNVKTMLFGIPLLYMYVFVVWFGIIVLIYSFTLRKDKSKSPEALDSFFIPPSAK